MEEVSLKKIHGHCVEAFMRYQDSKGEPDKS